MEAQLGALMRCVSLIVLATGFPLLSKAVIGGGQHVSGMPAESMGDQCSVIAELDQRPDRKPVSLQVASVARPRLVVPQLAPIATARAVDRGVTPLDVCFLSHISGPPVF